MVRDMDRFTTKENPKPELVNCVYCPEHSNCYSNMSCAEIYNALSKLRYYENLEEQGKLAVLPCKIGDTVYHPSYRFTECTAHKYTPKYKCDSECEGCCSECDSECLPYIYTGRVCGMNVLCMDNEAVVRVGVQFKEKWDTSNYIVGKDVFLTLEEAEEVLRGRL